MQAWRVTSGIASPKTCRSGPTNFWFDNSPSTCLLMRSVRTNDACNFQDMRKWKSTRPTNSWKASYAPGYWPSLYKCIIYISRWYIFTLGFFWSLLSSLPSSLSSSLWPSSSDHSQLPSAARCSLPLEPGTRLTSTMKKVNQKIKAFSFWRSFCQFSRLFTCIMYWFCWEKRVKGM